MNAHYRKLLNAKSAIDASVPRAYVSSQKVRDRHTRNEILSNGKRSASAGAGRPMNARGSRPSSARHSRPGSSRNAGTRKQFDTQAVEPFKLDDNDYENFTQDEINCINAMVNDTIDSERLDRVLNGGVPQLQAKGSVPKLDISIDQDHMKWLQDQSARKESKSYRPLEEELAVTGPGRAPSRGGAYTRSKIKKERSTQTLNADAQRRRSTQTLNADAQRRRSTQTLNADAQRRRSTQTLNADAQRRRSTQTLNADAQRRRSTQTLNADAQRRRSTQTLNADAQRRRSTQTLNADAQRRRSTQTLNADAQRRRSTQTLNADAQRRRSTQTLNADAQRRRSTQTLNADAQRRRSTQTLNADAQRRRSTQTLNADAQRRRSTQTLNADAQRRRSTQTLNADAQRRRSTQTLNADAQRRRSTQTLNADAQRRRSTQTLNADAQRRRSTQTLNADAQRRRSTQIQRNPELLGDVLEQVIKLIACFPNMEFSNKRRRVQILDYFGPIESNAERCQALTDEARRDSIKAPCNICHKHISGTLRVKSNFITHLRKSHPEAYVDYQMKTGRYNPEDSAANFSVASLDEASSLNAMRSFAPTSHASPLLPRGDNFGSLIPRHLPTSTVKEPSSASSPSDTSIKVEFEDLTGPVKNKSSNSHQTTTEALMDFIIGDLMSLKLVESSRFVRLVKSLNSNYPIPSLQDVTDVVEKTHARHRMRQIDKLKSVQSFYLSQEFWPTNKPGVKLATFSLHYIENWSFQHELFASTHRFGADPTEQDWKNAQKECLSEIIGESEILATLCGLADVHSLPGFLVPAKMSNSLFSGNSQQPEQKGYGSLLDQAVVNAVLRSGQETLDIIHNISQTLLKSNGRSWGQDITNCESFPWFEQLKLLDMVLCTEGSSDSTTADDIALISTVIEILRPFQEVAERIRTLNTVTCSLAFASIKLLKAALKDYEEAYPNSRLLIELKKEFYQAAEVIDNGESNMYTTATILDPRFKLQWCDSGNQDYFKKAFIDVLKNSKIVKPETADVKEVHAMPFQSGGFFTRILKQQPESLQAGTVTSEALRYFDEPLVQEDCDVLSYWQANENNLPNLSHLAQQYLAMPTAASGTYGCLELPDQMLHIKNTPLEGDVLQKVVELRPSFQQ
ncbi:uncharacterized protein [Watersipora subatra]|uniref:uncharacterized protein n=1 Tax=Watersipora subatra TaxID=2589382 RepID=UPI00355B245D